MWHKIPGYDGYMITKSGTVLAHEKTWFTGRTMKTKITVEEHIVKPFIKSNGYFHVTVNTKQEPIHRLLALAFIPNPENKKCVNHKDGNRINNSLENLEWATYSENNKHALATGARVNPSGIKNAASLPLLACFTGGKERLYESITQLSRELGINYYRAIRLANGEVTPRNNEPSVYKLTKEQYMSELN